MFNFLYATQAVFKITVATVVGVYVGNVISTICGNGPYGKARSSRILDLQIQKKINTNTINEQVQSENNRYLINVYNAIFS
jgi:hypothetical protein